MNKMINREKTYYTLEGDDLFRCCGEYQDRLYCVEHDKFQGCAFCSSFAYWESCEKDGNGCWDGEQYENKKSFRLPKGIRQAKSNSRIKYER